MSKLLWANFARLFRSVWFWACGLLMLLYSLWQAADLLSWAYNGLWAGERVDYISGRVGDFTVPMLVVLPVFCALFLGAEYHNNTIRNKIIAGYRRWQVYIANLVTVLAAALIYAGAHVLVTMAAGLLIRTQAWNVGEYTLRLLYCLPFILAVAAVSTLLSMLIRLRALPVLAILLAAALLWLPQRLHMRLSSGPENVVTDGVYSVETRDSSGEVSVSYWIDGREVAWEDLERVPNPKYVAEPRRSVYYFLMEALPGGQAFYLSDSLSLDRGSFLEMAACSLALAAASTALGLALFRRKDLK